MTPPESPRPPRPAAPPRTNVLAIVGLVLAIPFWPAGLVLSVVAWFQIRKTGQGGSELVVLGLVLSTVFAAISLGMMSAGGGGAAAGDQLRDDLQELQRRLEDSQRKLQEEGLPFRPEDLRVPLSPPPSP